MDSLVYRAMRVLSSTYRGLDKRSTLAFRDLTLVSGPNNGGKTQFLRSLVLMHALRRARPLSRRRGPFGSTLAQELSDLGFGDLAVEVADLIAKSKRPIELSWVVSVPASPSIATVAYSMFMDDGRKRAIGKGAREITIRAWISLDTQEFELHASRFEFHNLWGDLSLTVQNRKDGLKSEWKDMSGKPVRQETILESIRAEASEGDVLFLHPGAEVDKHLLHDFIGALTDLLPEVLYLGPVRVADDSLYHVGAPRGVPGVGRYGELTWVRLREANQDPEITERIDKATQQILGVSKLATSRLGVNKPAVKGQVGRLELPLSAMGLGSSQAVPVIVQLHLPASRKVRTKRHFGTQRILVFEEPESHLHPEAQRHLASTMCLAVKGGAKVVAETHSEVMLRAIELEVAKGTLAPKQVIVNWVDFRPRSIRGDVSRVQQIEFSPTGEVLHDMPASFDEVVSDIIMERLLMDGEPK